MSIVGEDSKYYYDNEGSKYNKREYCIGEDGSPDIIVDCSDELKEESGVFIPIVKCMNFIFQRVYLMITDERKYLSIYDGPADYASSKCLRLDIEKPEIVPCKDGILEEWWLVDGMVDYLCDFLKSNVREGLPVEPLSVWDYMVYLYNKETGQDMYFEMPDYTEIIRERDRKEKEEFGDDDFDDSIRLASRELKEDAEVVCLSNYRITDKMYLSIPEQPTVKYSTYFMLTNALLGSATKVCRISFIEPKYIECNDMPEGVENWILSKEEIHTLIHSLTDNNNDLWNDLLEMKSETQWPIFQTILIGIDIPDYTKLQNKENNNEKLRELKERRQYVIAYENMISDDLMIIVPISPYTKLPMYFIIAKTKEYSMEEATEACRLSFTEPKYIQCNDMLNVEPMVLSEEEINVVMLALKKNDNEIWNDMLRARDEEQRESIHPTILFGIGVPDYTKLLDSVK